MLYICPTPIGNLEDITLRTLKILRQVEAIACEDTRTSGILLRRFHISTPTFSYHQHNEISRGEEIMERLGKGEDIALISDAGMPGISDPGTRLIQKCHEKNLPVTVLPGANAGLTALVAAGWGEEPFTFIGFLPSSPTPQKKALEQLKALPTNMVFYEAPHRVKKTVLRMEEVFGDRPIVFARELTKTFEEVVFSTLSHAVKNFPVKEKGEFVLLVGKKEEEVEDVDIARALIDAMAQGRSRSRAVKEVAQAHGLSKNLVYEVSLTIE